MSFDKIEPGDLLAIPYSMYSRYYLMVKKLSEVRSMFYDLRKKESVVMEVDMLRSDTSIFVIKANRKNV